MVCSFGFHFILVKGGLRCKEGMVLLRGSDGELGFFNFFSQLVLHQSPQRRNPEPFIFQLVLFL